MRRMSPAELTNGGRKALATIYDIARLVDVSPSTVSRALNKPGRINPKTEQRIRDAAKSLGYRANPMARSLPTGRTGTIGLMLSDITNPVYFDLIRGAERVMSAEGQTLVLAESQEAPERELDAAERLLTSVDGLILVASRLRDEQIYELTAFKPVVLVNRQVKGVPSVVPNVAPGLSAAVTHLAGLGHRSIAYLSGPSTSWMNDLRWQVLFDLAVTAGLSIVEIGPGTPTMAGGSALLPRVVASGVTALIAYNDLMALGVLRTCRDQGIMVPDGLSIIGFDDIFGTDLTTPALTTIRSPLAELGEMAVRMLAGRTGAQASPPTVFVPRTSTAAPY
jgi:DNA-binding LacI/PurR family transcriptional regulator